VINKVGELLSRNYRGVIQIQSGLNEQTISLAAGVGATKFVSGDYIMRFNSLEDGILRLRTAAEEGFGGA